MPHYAVTIVEFVDAETPEAARAMVMEDLTERLNMAADPDADVDEACKTCGNILEQDEDSDDEDALFCPTCKLRGL